MRGNLHFIPRCNITRPSQNPVVFILSASTIWTGKAALIDPLLVAQHSFRFHFLSFSSTFHFARIHLSPPRQSERGTAVQQAQDQLSWEAVSPAETTGLQKRQCPQHTKLPVAWSPSFNSFWFQTQDTSDPALLPRGSHFSVSTCSSQHDAASIYEKTTTKTSSQAFTLLEHRAHLVSVF